MTLDESLAGKEIPKEIRDSLTIVTVSYFSFTREIREGQFVVHRDLVHDVQRIFETLCTMQFPIARVVPIVSYAWDDDASMKDNNSSAFNYRCIACTERLSNHAYGRALDINPMQNPYRQKDGVIVPFGATYDMRVPGTITPDIARIFYSYGWMWGGDWEETKDWQHFEKI